MIGYYVHHHGRGHLHRAQSLVADLQEPVTGLSSLPRPDSWPGPWVQLPRDDEGGNDDVTAGGRLHWAPRHSVGVRGRAARLSAWIESAHPRLVVVDVSAETSMLVRLHGVPVVSVVLPGERTDPAHLAAFAMSEVLVAAWPSWAEGLTPGLPAHLRDRVQCLGAVSRFAPQPQETPGSGARRHVVVLQGGGSTGALIGYPAEELEQQTPGWWWTVLGGSSWVDDPSLLLRSADVVVTHAGQGAVSDVAAHRRPAVVVPAERPFGEQVATAAVLAGSDLPVLVEPTLPTRGWDRLLEQAAGLDGRRWDRWYDGRAARRFARVLAAVPDRATRAIVS